MSTNNAFNDNITRSTSTIPSLDTVDEIIYSENLHGGNVDERSDGKLSVIRSGDFDSKISKKLTYDILKRFSQNNPLFKLEEQEFCTDNMVQKNTFIHPKNEKNAASSTNSLIRRRKSLGIQYEAPFQNGEQSNSRSSSVGNVKIRRLTSRATAISHSSLPDMNEKQYAEKTTYCRPVTKNFYNEEYIFKNSEKNQRLQKLVKKMAIAREREKQENAWNNYINELKNKHKYEAATSYTPSNLDQRSLQNLIEDFYWTKFKSRQSNICRNLLNELYEPCTSTQMNYYDYQNFMYDRRRNILSTGTTPKKNTTGVDPLIILSKDESNQCGPQYNSRPAATNIYSNTILVDRQCSQIGENSKMCHKSILVNKNRTMVKNSMIQTQLKLLPARVKRHEDADIVKDKFKAVSEDVDNIKNQITDAKTDQRRSSLENIESKLDVLIRSLNTLISEVRSNSATHSSSLVNSNNRMTISRSVDAVAPPKTEYIVQKLGNDISTKVTLYPQVNLPKIVKKSVTSKLDNIIVEEINKSNEVKRDIDNILNGDSRKTCTVEILTDYIPTREHSTEVTDSLSKANSDTMEEINRDFSDENRMTIAVNTDPLGLQALLKISREAVRNFLSYMQRFPYLQFPMLRDNGATSFVCSICGAAFLTSSQLTQHIQCHIITRNCCECRHLTGLQIQNPRRIFLCEYCGKPFSRAYCCELHQQICAKRLGKIRDVTSSLVLLR